MAYLGIDAGASSTKWAISDGDRIIDSGSLEPMDGHIYREDSAAKLERNLQEIAKRAKGVTAIFAGITGISEEFSGRDLVKKAFSSRFPDAMIEIVNDIELAYRAHFEPGEGIFLYGGTGSIAIHITSEGKVIRAGGWGYLLGDEGGGYWIGREAIRKILSAFDAHESIKPASFEAHILAFMNATNWGDIKTYVYSQDRSRVAAISTKVFELADGGDVTAQSILRQSAQHLAALVAQIDRNLPAGNHPVLFAGGVSQPGSYLMRTLEHEVKNELRTSTIDITIRAAELASKL